MRNNRSLSSKWFLLSLLVVALGGTAGCGGGSREPQNSQTLTAEDRARMAPRDDFEGSRDLPITADTHFAAGHFAESQGNLAQAMEQYRKSLKLKPDHKPTIFRSAVVLVKQRKLPQAVEMWERYVKVTNGEAPAYANLGFAMELSGRTTDAEQAYLKGVKRDPTNAVCRVNYGLMLARKERFNEAVLQLQTVLSEAEVHYNIASVYEALGRREQARVEYRKALAADPKLAEAQVRLDAMN